MMTNTENMKEKKLINIFLTERKTNKETVLRKEDAAGHCLKVSESLTAALKPPAQLIMISDQSINQTLIKHIHNDPAHLRLWSDMQEKSFYCLDKKHIKTK